MALFKKKTTQAEETQAPKEKKVAKKKVTESSTTGTVQNKKGSAFRVLLKAVLSEKAAVLESHRSYVFSVHPQATKEEIKRAVFQVYGVVPEKIRTLHVDGKQVRFGMYSGKRKGYKKAVVTLKKGDSIRIHEGV